MPVAGSSPRVRGTRMAIVPVSSYDRFIPACAGNTKRQAKRNINRSVHPRVCGEHLIAEIGEGPSLGSSPRVRGTHLAACWNACRKPVHPRVCGEHCSAHWRHSTGYGSSPRVRGTQGFDFIVHFRFRFIPACAGNTGQHFGSRRGTAVHPRVCGEHTSFNYLIYQTKLACCDSTDLGRRKV